MSDSRRYIISHPKRGTSNLSSAQAVGNFLYRTSEFPDWKDYRVTDTETGKIYSAKLCETLNGIEFSEIEI